MAHPSGDERVDLLSQEIQHAKQYAVLLTSAANAQDQMIERQIEHLKQLRESIAGVHARMVEAEIELQKILLSHTEQQSPASDAGTGGQTPTPS